MKNNQAAYKKLQNNNSSHLVATALAQTISYNSPQKKKIKKRWIQWHQTSLWAC